MTRPVRIDAEPLKRWAASTLTAAGLPLSDAAEVAGHLIFADLRGIDTHGINRLKLYLDRVEQGAMLAVSQPRIIRESPVSALIDGANGFGQVTGRLATEVAIAKARESGMAAVAVRNSNHCGCMAYYTLLMAEAGLIGLAVTNATAGMPPHGGREAFFGTNPLSLAAPAGSHPPFVFDMATSQVARGKVVKAARENTPLPEGWAIGSDGQPTTDPVEALAGLVLPLGGPKGSGLAFMVELLSAVLSGALIGPQVPSIYTDLSTPQNVGHFFLAFRPDLFMPDALFRARVDETLNGLRQVAPAAGVDRVLAPGDLEREREAINLERGIPLSPSVLDDLEGLADRYGIPLPAERVI